MSSRTGRWVVIALAVALSATLAGCGGNSAQQASNTTAPSSATTTAAQLAKPLATKPSSATSTPSQPAEPPASALTPVANPALDEAVPVFMYHHIMPNPSNSIAITPQAFDQQMKYLRDNGYHPVSIADFDAFVLTGKRLPDKPVLITFDDGRMNQITYGVPILKKYGFAATFFVVKKWIVTSSPSFMHAPELKQLIADGFDVESHTTNHIMIHPFKRASGGMESYASMKQRYWEPTYGMRTWMDATLGGKPMIALAYPGGRYNPDAEQLMRDSGYDLAFTTDDGYVAYQRGKNQYALPRWNTGARGTTLGTFAYILKGAQRAAARSAKG